MQKSKDLYDVYFWPDDPFSIRGQQYLSETICYFQKLYNSIDFSVIKDKKEIEILEICAGAGYGSLVFSSLFPDKKLNVLLTDTRDTLMESAKLSAKLGVNSRFKVLDALQIETIDKKFDVVILYGLSTPHFAPRAAIELYQKVQKVLNKDGVFIVQEMDRRKSLFLDGNYHKKAYAEGHGERLISEEKGYDVYDGMIEREYYSEHDPTKKVYSKSFMWSIAETDALLSLYWKQVDKLPLGGEKYFLVAH